MVSERRAQVGMGLGTISVSVCCTLAHGAGVKQPALHSSANCVLLSFWPVWLVLLFMVFRAVGTFYTCGEKERERDLA